LGATIQSGAVIADRKGATTIMVKSKPRRLAPGRRSKPANSPSTTRRDSAAVEAAAGDEDAPEAAQGPGMQMTVPRQSAPVERVYLGLVVGRKTRPPRKPGMMPLPAAYGAGTGNYLLELTAFHGGEEG